MKRALTTAVLMLQCVVLSQRASAQLTLLDAMHRADHSAFGNRLASGAADERQAQSLAPLRGVLPSVRVEAGYVRTTDPIGAFGSTLRQRAITQTDFDPGRLNHPAAIGNYQGGIVVEQPLVNVDAWLGRRASLQSSDAIRALERWTRLSIRVDVVRAYYGVVLAAERVTFLRSAVGAAHAHQAEAEALVLQGMATRSDALLAAVRVGEMESQLTEAEGNASIARRQLAVILGGDGIDDALDELTHAVLPSADRIRSVVGGDTSLALEGSRADVDAAARGLDAARTDAFRARAARLPRINSFARYDWNSPVTLYGGEKNWTTGIVASWSIFAGASEFAESRGAAARAIEARAQVDAAQANARLDVEQTRTTLQVALARLTIAERSVAQSAEAHRIVGRKYAGGLATVAELLDSQATELQSALSFAQSRYAVIVSAAERRRAVGGDPATLAALDHDPTVAADAAAPAASRQPH